MSTFPRKTLCQLTWPLFVFSFLTMGVTLVDNWLVNAYSPSLAAAVSLANLVLDIPYEISAAFSVGALILVAQCLGRNDEETARQIASVALLASLVLGGIVAAVVFLGAETFVRLVNTPEEVYHDTVVYVRISGVTLLFNGFLTAATAVLRGFGQTVAILLFGFAANGLYLFLEYVLIFGRWGFPELGVVGAALSTLIVRFAGVLLLGWYLWRFTGLRGAGGRFWRHAGEFCRRLAKLSLPTLGESVVFKVHQTILVALIATFGTSAVLTRSYVLALTAFLSLIPYVLSQGNDVLIGYDKGAKDSRSARSRSVRTTLFAAAAATLVAAGIFAASGPLLGLFTSDPQILSQARQILFLTILLQPFQVANTMFFGSLRAVGDVYVPVIYNILLTWLFALPLGWFLIAGCGWGVVGLWVALLAEEILKSSIMATRWVRMRWSRIDVLPSVEAPSPA